MVPITDRIAGITWFDCIRSVARWYGQCLQVSDRYMKWKPTSVSRVLIKKSIMSILRWFERPLNWPVVAKKAKSSAALGIRIFVESGLGKKD